MSHEVETMAWAREVPWHGLGVEVTPDITPQEMLVKAGLDWEVEKRPLWTPTFANGTAFADVDQSNPFQMIKGKSALTRVTDGKVFDIVGDRWNPVQNRDVLEFFTHFCKDGGATMETAGALCGGQVVWGLANLGNGFVLPGGDAIKGYLLLASKHQSGFATIGRVTPIRVVCANTFAMSGGFKAASQLRIPHTQEFKPEEAAEQIGLAREGISEFEKNARLLQKLNISRDDAIRILAPVFQPQDEVDDVVKDFDKNASRTVKKIMADALTGAGQREIAGTGWGLFNGVTFYANHTARGSADSRFASTLIGQNNIAANRVFTRLLEMADAD